MSDSNSDFCSKSNALPPCSQSRANSLRSRTSRSSTTDRTLHRILPSRSPSSSRVSRRRRESSSQRNSGLGKSTSASNINKNSNSTAVLSSISNFQSNDNLDNDESTESETICYDDNVQELSAESQLIKENITSNKYPFEIDKNRSKKQTTTSGKKLADEMYKLYEQQPDGGYRCTLCIDKIKVS